MAGPADAQRGFGWERHSQESGYGRAAAAPRPPAVAAPVAARVGRGDGDAQSPGGSPPGATPAVASRSGATGAGGLAAGSPRAIAASAVVSQPVEVSALAAPDPPPPSDFSFTVGARVWYTTSDVSWNFRSGNINVLSELRWRHVDAIIPEINAELRWKRWLLLGSVGRASVGDEGVFYDDDFLVSGRQARFSHTRSIVDGDDLWYVNGDIGFRVLSWGGGASRGGYLDLLAGYQYLEERYVAFGIRGVLDFSVFGIPPSSQSLPNSVRVIAHDYSWHSIRVGARAQVPIAHGFAVRGSAYVIPWSKSRMEDTHYLRDDFAKPCCVSRAEGGIGVQLDAALTYSLWDRLTVELGYRFLKIDSGHGKDTTRFSDPADGTATTKLNEMILERGGPYIGAQYRF